MRISRLYLGVALLAAICPGFASAQSPIEPAVMQVADGVEEAAPAAPAAESANCDPDPCGPPQPWSLPQPRLTQALGMKIGGWVQSGITSNNRAPLDGYNSTVALNDFDHQYQMNQAWMYFIKPVDQTSCEWQLGGRLDMLYGTDWRFGRFFGLESRINGDDQLYGWVLPQMYVELGGNNLSVKIGHQAGPLGYEMVPSVANAFYSHSLAMSFTEPQLVTGLWADYKLSDQWTVQGGFHRGWFMFEDLDENLDVMGGIQWTSCDQRTSVRYAFTTGNDSGVPLLGQNYASSLVLQHQLTEKLKYVAQHNLGTSTNLHVWATQGAWYGLNNYFLYTINPCWSAALRAEWLRDRDGTRVAGVGNLIDRGWKGAGYAGDFYEITAGLNWRPHTNVTFRPELRWDWYDGKESVIPGHALPYGNGDLTSQFTAAFDVLFTF